MDVDELELELIDFGADEIERGDGEVVVYTTFDSFARMQKALEDKSINILSAELQRIPTSFNELDNGTPVWYLMAKDEGHGFSKKSNRDFEFYATIQFVKQYLLN